MTVAPDGKKMTVVYTNKQTGRISTSVAEKQLAPYGFSTLHRDQYRLKPSYSQSKFARMVRRNSSMSTAPDFR